MHEERDVGIVSCVIEIECIFFPLENTLRMLLWGFFVKSIMMLFRCGHVFQKASFLFSFLPEKNERKCSQWEMHGLV